MNVKTRACTDALCIRRGGGGGGASARAAESDRPVVYAVVGETLENA